MHVRVRLFGCPEKIVVVDSKLTKIEKFRQLLRDKFGIEPTVQKLFYGGKLLENGYTFHDYSIKLNDVIQLMYSSPGNNAKATNLVTAGSSKPSKEYTDAVCHLYSLGDLVDMRDQELGAWMEGKITRIVYNPDVPLLQHCPVSSSISVNNDRNDKIGAMDFEHSDESLNGNDVENKPPINQLVNESTKQVQRTEVKETESSLLYQVQVEKTDDEPYYVYCKLKDIRPRARNEIQTPCLQIGQTVMINHNTDEPLEKGYWYDFKLEHLNKLRTYYELTGTLFLGPDSIPQDDTRIRIHDKIFAIEKVVPVAQRTPEIKKIMITPTIPRSAPLSCLTCRDNMDVPCKDCGCNQCSGKELPGKIVLCDECNNGYHMYCLEPALNELPEGDWYCPECKRDPNDVVAPGAAKQTKKISKTNRDWGRGMACVGKTKTCTMPANHFGPIPGIEVGMRWRFRIQLSEIGVHRPPVSGIHGRDVEGAYSIVLSGGYEDDVDYGNEFTYTGSGGRDLSGNKRTAEQSHDQTLTRENKALARNCAVKNISEEGADAGDDWRNGKPVRVVRSYKMLKFFPQYAPEEGNRYDGIYKVVKYYPEKGMSGFRVWKYLLRRDDPNPAPWEVGATVYPIIYPDGYLEAEAEKVALKLKNKGKGKATNGGGKKRRALQESNQTTDSNDNSSPPAKKRKQDSKVTEEELKNKNSAIIFQKDSSSTKQFDRTLSEQESEAIKADTLNAKLWEDCRVVCETKGKKEFIEYVTQEFLCIICRDVVVCPATTPCLHNFCTVCLKEACKSSGLQCPCCRNPLGEFVLTPNEHLTAALRTILPGYDAGKQNNVL